MRTSEWDKKRELRGKKLRSKWLIHWLRLFHPCTRCHVIRSESVFRRSPPRRGRGRCSCSLSSTSNRNSSRSIIFLPGRPSNHLTAAFAWQRATGDNSWRKPNGSCFADRAPSWTINKYCKWHDWQQLFIFTKEISSSVCHKNGKWKCVERIASSTCLRPALDTFWHQNKDK